MQAKSIWKILLVDDDEDDYLLTKTMLAEMRGKKPQLEWVSTFEDGRKALSRDHYDAVLMDYDLGPRTGLDLIREAVANEYPAPIILLTGRGSYEVDVEAMRAGATLYLTKTEVNSLLLERSIRYAIERKQTEEDLRRARDEAQANAAWMKLAQQAGGVGFFDWDMVANTSKWTEQLELIYGVPPAQGSSEKWPDFVHPEDKADVDERVRKAILEQRSEVVGDYRIIRPDGEVRWLSNRGMITYDYTGKPLRMTGATVDITERKRAQEALQSSEERFSKAFNATPNALVISRIVDGKIELINDSFERLFGYSRAEVLGKTSLELNMIADPADREEAIRRLRAEQVLRNFETNIRLKSGEIRQAILSIEMLDIENETFILTVIEDVTERKRAEAALKVSQATMDAFFEASPGILNLFDPQLRYINTDPITPTYFGFDRQSIIGQSVQDLNPPFVEQFLGPILRRVTESGQPELNLEVPGPIPSRGGEMGYWRVSYFPVPLPDGQRGLGVMGVDITDSKQAQEALHEREEMLRLALTASGAGAWSWDLHTNTLQWSDEYYRIFGFEPGSLEPSAEAGLSRVHPDDLPETEALLREALECGTQIDTVHRVIWPDGSIHWVRGISSAFYDPYGKPVRMAGIAIDITAQKRAEIKLQEANRQTVEILESISDAFYSLDPDGHFTYVNQKAASLWGRQPADLLGKNIWEEFPAGKETESYWKIQEALETSQPIQYESYSAFLDQWIDVHLYPTEQGVSVYFQDITSRKRSEHELQEREERLALLSEAAADLLSDRDPGELLNRIYGRLAQLLDLEVFVHYNLDAEGTRLELSSISGFSEKSCQALERLNLGQAVCGTVALTHQPLIVADVQNSSAEITRFIRSEALSAYACFPLKAQDRLIGTLSFGSRQRTHFDPNSIALLHTVADLIATAIDRWRAEADLQVYARQLERRNRDLQEFAFVASHDLQEPLRKIETFGDVLENDANCLSEHQRDYLARIRTSAGRMRAMVNGLLELSRLDSRSTTFERVELSAVIQEVLTDLEAQIQSTGAQIEVDRLPVIEAERVQISRLFQNLIGNALKFQPAGNMPRVRIFSQALPSGQVQISIQDNGIGFPTEVAERILEPFQRAVGKSEYPGSGIGLAICRKIVEYHQGSLTAHSQDRQGAIFEITLPVRQEQSRGKRTPIANENRK